MKRCILFIATHGGGLGHLTRALAVALRLRKLTPQFEILFFTTSTALEVIRENGFTFFYVPPADILAAHMSYTQWKMYLEQQISEVLGACEPEAVVFDGVLPTAGFAELLRESPAIKKVWLKRECYKKSYVIWSQIEGLFDRIISPKEASLENKEGSKKKKYVEPIMFLDREEAYDRQLARKQLKVEETQNLIYVQLGSGIINDIDKMIDGVTSSLTRNKNNTLLVGESIIGRHFAIDHPQVRVIRGYPNALYFKALDLAVSAAGYNTFHELMYFGIPAVFMPNMKTMLDDQKARAEMAVQAGAAFMLESFNLKQFETQFERLCKDKESMGKKAAQLVFTNGAMEAAKSIQEIL